LPHTTAVRGLGPRSSSLSGFRFGSGVSICPPGWDCIGSSKFESFLCLPLLRASPPTSQQIGTGRGTSTGVRGGASTASSIWGCCSHTGTPTEPNKSPKLREELLLKWHRRPRSKPFAYGSSRERQRFYGALQHVDAFWEASVWVFSLTRITIKLLGCSNSHSDSLCTLATVSFIHLLFRFGTVLKIKIEILRQFSN
jgi:hypothetical protein